MGILHIMLPTEDRQLRSMTPEVEEDIQNIVNETPDLNPTDFTLRGHLKLLVYLSLVDDLDALKNLMVTGFQKIHNLSGIWDCIWMD
jgi:hypothetical protein